METEQPGTTRGDAGGRAFGGDVLGGGGVVTRTARRGAPGTRGRRRELSDLSCHGPLTLA